MPERPPHRPDPDRENPLVAAVAHHMHLEGDDEPPGESGGPPDGPPPGPPRDPGSPGIAFLTWLALLAAVGLTVAAQWAPPPAAAPSEMSRPGGLMQIMGRYVVGAPPLTSSLGEEMDEATVEKLAGQLEQFTGSPEDRLRAAIVKAELLGPEAGREAIDAVLEELGAEDDPPVYADQLRADAEAVRALLSDDAEAPADADGLRERHGWFGDLALTQGLADEAPAREPVMAKARRTVSVALIGIGLFAGLCVVGFVLAIVALVLGLTGKLKRGYAPPAPGGSVYLEVFAIFLLGFLGVSAASGALQASTGVDYSRFLVWLLLLVPIWALVRGAPLRNFRFAMGWHGGRGLFREIGAGLVGYVACLPIFLAGVALTLLLGALINLLPGPGEEAAPPPTHPIIDQVIAGNPWAIVSVFVLAVVWAPLVEESIFRGAFYHHLRGRLGVILASLGVGFVFAIIHPQGIIAVPALMSLGVIFCLIREWRGSLIGPVVAHAAHNGALVTGLVLALS